MGNRVCVDERGEQKLKSKKEPTGPIQDIKAHINSGNKQGVLDELNKILSKNVEHYDTEVKEEFKDQSLLHIAIKYDQTNDLHFVKKVLNKQPQILNRTEAKLEQTALHVAIVQGNYKAVEILLEFAAEKDKTKQLLEKCADRDKFKNTVLMAQLPLSVAALMLKANDSNSRDIVDLLLKHSACISKKNKHGDTLFHSLIEYGDIYPDKISDVTFAFKYLWEKYTEKASKEKASDKERKSKPTDILFWENEDNLTPLQLSAKLGVSEIFDYIINISDVYCFQNARDGLFDIRTYDVTEFDRLIPYIDKQKTCWKKYQELSILEMLFDSRCNLNEAFQILNQKVIRFILQKKWNTYWFPMMIWMFMHFFFIIFATIVTVQKSDVLVCSDGSLDSCDLNENPTVIGVVYLLVGLIYFFIALMIVYKLLARCCYGSRGLVWHNLDYIICLTVVSFGALLESVLTFLRTHWDYHLICLLLCGWYFMLYFSPFSKNLVAFTYMMKAGLLGDFVPFSFIFTFLLIAFTTAMHVLFKGADEDPEEFHTFRESILTMFKLGVGLNDIGVLNQSRIPWLAYTMFVLFAILSFIHLLNALIAIMSQTFSDVHKEKNSYHKYQKLCMIELFEDIMITPFLVKLIPCIDRAKHWTTRRELPHPEDNDITRYRYLTTVHSLDDSFYGKEDKEERMKSDVQINVSQVIDLIRKGNNEVIYLMQNAKNENKNIINEREDITFVVERSDRDQSQQFPEVN
ncbi:transient receptor potential cation channel subfamily V member 3-like [Ostrea edulis]|uniref:transient receptor potential cation channel subfamily V member 3-like n=1 Tax=Ostrea edulis TaxID=37623 RepID=UPI0024AF0B26|nr:transient receptor potential cation channel subfamily V member 3-like [Ostrea edulis]